MLMERQSADHCYDLFLIVGFSPETTEFGAVYINLGGRKPELCFFAIK